MSDGVWVKIWPENYDPSGVPGGAVISGHNGATVQNNVPIGDKTYDIYTFTDDTATDLSLTVSEPGGFADVVVVGGGGHGAGGAGGHSGGGGGAGGLLEARVFLDQGNNPVKVGGAPNYYGYAANGEASFVGNHVAPGGGAGCNGTYSSAGNGGSGGGGKTEAAQAATTRQGMGTPGLGHDGDKTMPFTGGGGGAGGPGVGTEGGPGKDVYITGTKLTLAAGGKGNGPNVSNPAPANSGNGGTTYSAGGSGIVIVRVEI